MWLFKILLSSQILNFLRGGCWELLECHKVPSKSPSTLWSRKQLSYPGAVLASIEDDYIKGSPYLSPYYEAKKVSFGIQDQGGADQTNWTPCLCLHGSKLFSIGQDIQTDASDWLLTIAGANSCWHTDTRTATIGTGLMCYLLMSP